MIDMFSTFYKMSLYLVILSYDIHHLHHYFHVIVIVILIFLNDGD